MVDGRLIRYSYLIAGLLETGVCLITYFGVFLSHGINGSVLWNSTQTYWMDNSPDLVVNGRVYPASEQVTILREAHSGYYLTLIICQIWNLFACKTRFISLFKHGPLQNHISAYGIFVAIFVALFFIYVNDVQDLFETANLSGYWFLPQFLFGAMILAYSEYSKKLTRENPNGWWARHMQW